jgi:hypothetical protein
MRPVVALSPPPGNANSGLFIFQDLVISCPLQRGPLVARRFLWVSAPAPHARGGRRRSWNQARYLLIFSRCAAGA